MLSTGELAGLRFECGNVIDFWIVGLAAVETEETPAENIVDWLKNDSDDGWYKHLQTTALMLILKYTMLAMGMPAGDVYELTVTAMMRSVLTFKIEDMKSEGKKYELVCRPGQKPLSLEDLVPYVYIDSEKDGKAVDVEIPEREAKSPLTLSLPRLRPGVHAAESLCVTLVEPPESRFATSPGLSDIDHIRRHARAVISMEKNIGFSPGPHHLDTLSPPVLAPEVEDKIARCYSYLPLERSDVFHTARMEQEITRLDIIVSQAANSTSALKAALARATKRKDKYKE